MYTSAQWRHYERRQLRRIRRFISRQATVADLIASSNGLVGFQANPISISKYPHSAFSGHPIRLSLTERMGLLIDVEFWHYYCPQRFSYLPKKLSKVWKLKCRKYVTSCSICLMCFIVFMSTIRWYIIKLFSRNISKTGQFDCMLLRLHVYWNVPCCVLLLLVKLVKYLVCFLYYSRWWK